MTDAIVILMQDQPRVGPGRTGRLFAWDDLGDGPAPGVQGRSARGSFRRVAPLRHNRHAFGQVMEVVVTP